MSHRVLVAILVIFPGALARLGKNDDNQWTPNSNDPQQRTEPASSSSEQPKELITGAARTLFVDDDVLQIPITQQTRNVYSNPVSLNQDGNAFSTGSFPVPNGLQNPGTAVPSGSWYQTVTLPGYQKTSPEYPSESGNQGGIPGSMNGFPSSSLPDSAGFPGGINGFPEITGFPGGSTGNPGNINVMPGVTGFTRSSTVYPVGSSASISALPTSNAFFPGTGSGYGDISISGSSTVYPVGGSAGISGFQGSSTLFPVTGSYGDISISGSGGVYPVDGSPGVTGFPGSSTSGIPFGGSPGVTGFPGSSTFFPGNGSPGVMGFPGSSSLIPGNGNVYPDISISGTSTIYPVDGSPGVTGFPGSSTLFPGNGLPGVTGFPGSSNLFPGNGLPGVTGFSGSSTVYMPPSGYTQSVQIYPSSSNMLPGGGTPPETMGLVDPVIRSTDNPSFPTNSLLQGYPTVNPRSIGLPDIAGKLPGSTVYTDSGPGAGLSGILPETTVGYHGTLIPNSVPPMTTGMNSPFIQTIPPGGISGHINWYTSGTPSGNFPNSIQYTPHIPIMKPSDEGSQPLGPNNEPFMNGLGPDQPSGIPSSGSNPLSPLGGSPVTFGPSPSGVSPVTFGPNPSGGSPVTFGPSPSGMSPISFGPSPSGMSPLNFGPSPSGGSPVTFSPSPSGGSPVTFSPSLSGRSPVTFDPSPSGGSPGNYPFSPLEGSPGSFNESPNLALPGNYPLSPLGGSPGSYPLSPLEGSPGNYPGSPYGGSPGTYPLSPFRGSGSYPLSPLEGSPGNFPGSPYGGSPGTYPLSPFRGSPGSYPLSPLEGSPGNYPGSPYGGSLGTYPLSPFGGSPGSYPLSPLEGSPGTFSRYSLGVSPSNYPLSPLGGSSGNYPVSPNGGPSSILNQSPLGAGESQFFQPLQSGLGPTNGGSQCVMMCCVMYQPLPGQTCALCSPQGTPQYLPGQIDQSQILPITHTARSLTNLMETPNGLMLPAQGQEPPHRIYIKDDNVAASRSLTSSEDSSDKPSASKSDLVAGK